ncbi:hypothetical protein [Martelella sp. HB161492]|uniref:hypothetical protein n=1 Tax=Martelella sp. HB161492 TaxID=2720726 RepID=UPI00159010F6|nr:hypothetical protein [Martelella sp. HB161492]
MAADIETLIDWLSGLASAIVSDSDDLGDLTARLEEMAALGSDDAAAEALSIMQVIGESVSTEVQFAALKLDPDATDDTLSVMQVLLSFGLAIGGPRVDWRSRPSARAARQRISDAGVTGVAVAAAMGVDGNDLYAWLASVIAMSVRIVSELAATATPMVTVRTSLSLPSSVLAHKLYGDPTRAQELVDGAGSGTPLVMPTTFNALAS